MHMCCTYMYINVSKQYYRSLHLTQLYVIGKGANRLGWSEVNKIVCAPHFSEISTCPPSA